MIDIANVITFRGTYVDEGYEGSQPFMSTTLFGLLYYIIDHEETCHFFLHFIKCVFYYRDINKSRSLPIAIVSLGHMYVCVVDSRTVFLSTSTA